MATEQGIVIKTGTDTAWVKTTKTSACAGCASRNSCTATGGDMEVEALNLAGARVGDRIALTFDTSPLLKATFFIYVFPILCMLLGAVIGLQLAPFLGLNPSGCSAVGAFSFLFAAMMLVRIRGNKMADNKAYRPKITRIFRQQ